jgi:hypothetical protein
MVGGFKKNQTNKNKMFLNIATLEVSYLYYGGKGSSAMLEKTPHIGHYTTKLNYFSKKHDSSDFIKLQDLAKEKAQKIISSFQKDDDETKFIDVVIIKNQIYDLDDCFKNPLLFTCEVHATCSKKEEKEGSWFPGFFSASKFSETRERNFTIKLNTTNEDGLNESKLKKLMLEKAKSHFKFIKKDVEEYEFEILIEKINSFDFEIQKLNPVEK